MALACLSPRYCGLICPKLLRQAVKHTINGHLPCHIIFVVSSDDTHMHLPCCINPHK